MRTIARAHTLQGITQLMRLKNVFGKKSTTEIHKRLSIKIAIVYMSVRRICIPLCILDANPFSSQAVCHTMLEN